MTGKHQITKYSKLILHRCILCIIGKHHWHKRAYDTQQCGYCYKVRWL